MRLSVCACDGAHTSMPCTHCHVSHLLLALLLDGLELLQGSAGSIQGLVRAFQLLSAPAQRQRLIAGIIPAREHPLIARY